MAKLRSPAKGELTFGDLHLPKNTPPSSKAFFFREYEGRF